MSDWPLVGARRFEVYMRWSAYTVATVPAGTFARNLEWTDRLDGVAFAAFTAAGVLCLALIVANVLVINHGINTVVGRAQGAAVGSVTACLVLLVALVVATRMIPLPAMGMTVAAAIGAVAAGLVLVLNARRTLQVNVVLVLLYIPLASGGEIALITVGAAMITVVLWGCWSCAWTLRVLLELQAAHEDRAELALANERLRIGRDLHDVFGRTLATIAVKSSLAAELARRGHNERAAAEISEVQRLAGAAGSEVRHVVRGELRTTWAGEVAGARSLLAAAGIDCTVTGAPVPEERAEALARVVREGVTNVLRHSAATRVTITTAAGADEVSLVLANDGVGAASPAPDGADAIGTGEGTGLRSMAERLQADGGRLTARRDGAWFRLEAVIPLARTAPGTEGGPQRTQR